MRALFSLAKLFVFTIDSGHRNPSFEQEGSSDVSKITDNDLIVKEYDTKELYCRRRTCVCAIKLVQFLIDP